MDDKKSIRELFKEIEESFNFDLAEKEHYKKSVASRRKKSDLLNNCLSQEDFDLLQEYLEEDNVVSEIEMEEAFVKGFSMAYKLLIDSLL